MKPSPDAFEEWRASPITQWVLDSFLAAEMERTKRTYQERAWGGVAGPEDQGICRERYETLAWVRGLDMMLINEVLEMHDG